MPASVQNAVPTTVMPQSLSRAFAHERGYPLIENEYKNGESQRSVLAANSRKHWRLAKRLPPATLQELRDFYDARGGPTEAFYFYDPYETSPKFSWDPTGTATTGRYTVRFNGEWNQTSDPGRSSVNVELIELA
jgi:phage-related protein